MSYKRSLWIRSLSTTRLRRLDVVFSHTGSTTQFNQEIDTMMDNFSVFQQDMTAQSSIRSLVWSTCVIFLIECLIWLPFGFPFWTNLDLKTVLLTICGIINIIWTWIWDLWDFTSCLLILLVWWCDSRLSINWLFKSSIMPKVVLLVLMMIKRRPCIMKEKASFVVIMNWRERQAMHILTRLQKEKEHSRLLYLKSISILFVFWKFMLKIYLLKHWLSRIKEFLHLLLCSCACIKISHLLYTFAKYEILEHWRGATKNIK